MNCRKWMIIVTACSMFSANIGYAQTAADSAQNTAADSGEKSEESSNSAEQAPQKSIYDNPDLKPRDVYNLALEQYGAGNLDSAAEGFLKARDFAAFDNDLRFNAAYNLAHVYADIAEKAGDISTIDEQALQGVIDSLTMSVSWFRDAAHQMPSLEEGRGNLEIVLKRLMAARDVMAQKYNTIERQLDTAAAQEGKIRESARVLAERIKQTGAVRDPIAYQDEFRAIAKIQREVLTQAGLTAENIANAMARLNQKSEQERSQEEAMRLFQLQSASSIFDDARTKMTQARRQMRDLSVDDMLRQTTNAYYALKQAREQLEDPMRILGHLLQDQGDLVRLSDAKYSYDTPEILEKIREQQQNPSLSTPVWLNFDLLSDTQNDIMMRTNRIAAFLRMAVESAKQQPQAQQPQDPNQAEAAKEQMAQIEEALPFIESAASRMQEATQAIEISDINETLQKTSAAMEQLVLAMERFADLRRLIEIAYQTQTGVTAAVRGKAGEEGSRDTSENNGEHDEKYDLVLSRESQRAILRKALPQNIERLSRMSDKLAAELAKMNKKASEAAQAAAAQGQGQNDASDEEQMKIQKLFEQAENLRSDALSANERMVSIVDAAPETPNDGINTEDIPENNVQASPEQAEWTELSGDALSAQQSIEQLRMLFFSVIEHVQELLKQQSKTMDQTTDAASLPAEQLALKLPPVIDRQHTHEITADQLAEVIRKQAEQLQAQGQQAQGQQAQGPDPAEMAQRYAQAAGELQSASALMRQIQTDLTTEEHHFTEAIKEQNEAVEHISKALEFLQPPQNQQQQNQQNQQNQEQQNQEQQKQQQMSQEQAEKKIQQIRSRDQERRRQREQKERAAGGMSPVEKDW